MSPTVPAEPAAVGRWHWGAFVLSSTQRKPVEEVADGLDPGVGDVSAKRSRFWVLLVLSALIASAGVVTDSTATVIGAMIIAPLATPIMGIALGAVLADRGMQWRTRRMLALGTVAVIVIGALFAVALPSSFDLLANSQVTGRTSPTLFDMVAAIATGLAGSVGLVRRDVSDVLPGVAVAISLVPPLAVCGVCLGQREFELAFGAFVLFASNVIAMVLTGIVIFAVAYRHADAVVAARSRRRTYLAIAPFLFAVVVVLVVNTAVTVATEIYTQRVTDAAQTWISGISGAEVVDVSYVPNTAVITVLTPSDPPPVDELLALLEDKVPDGVGLQVNVEQGQRIVTDDAG
jgi:uncharacterized hydrophobic protein (TIGR00271 family)